MSSDRAKAIAAKRLATIVAKKAQLNDPDQEPCALCKSWSPSKESKSRNIGWCMRNKRSVKATGTCGEWRPNIVTQFKL